MFGALGASNNSGSPGGGGFPPHSPPHPPLGPPHPPPLKENSEAQHRHAHPGQLGGERAQRAEGALLRVVKIRAMEAADDTSFSKAHADLAQFYLSMGAPDKALPQLHAAVHLLEETLGEGHATLAPILALMGHAYYAQGEPKLALESYKSAMLLLEKVPPCPRALLEGEGAPSGQSQSGCRAVTGDLKAVGGGGYWRLEMRLGADVGVWECLWGRVSAVGRGEGGNPPPPLFKRFPALPPVAVRTN